jgi:inhibitor of KinA sporulation pathway (predicted exonuclease)
MEYIVFDLEWNQCPDGKGKEEPRLPFEIIEIGAWKLDEQRKMTDKFHAIIRPQVYTRLHPITREVIGLKDRNLMEGEPFCDAVRSFLDWCGKNPIFCTWGDLDLMELQRNMKFYQLESLLSGPLYYYDIQKLFSLAYGDGKSRKSLEYGIDYLKLPKNQEFHRALEDAGYTAKIFQCLDMGALKAYFSVDVYQNPKNKKEEIHLSYPGYDKYISREFPDKETAIRDREVCSTRCPLCHKPAKRKIRWFSANSRHFYSLSLCGTHGLIKGKIRMKKSEDGNCYVVKTLKPVDGLEAESIRNKQIAVRKKRRQKYKRDKMIEKNG